MSIHLLKYSKTVRVSKDSLRLTGLYQQKCQPQLCRHPLALAIALAISVLPISANAIENTSQNAAEKNVDSLANTSAQAMPNV